MDLETMLITAAVVAAAGAISTQHFREADSPYLITIAGGRAHNVFMGALLWASALIIGVIALLLVSMLTSGVVAIALFFGIEAIALDICAQRTRYVHVDSPKAAAARVPSTHR